MRCGFQPQASVQQNGRADKRVAVQAAEPREFRILKSRDLAQQVNLRAVLHLGLETDDIPERALLIILPQLYHRMRARSGFRIGQADGFHRPKSQRVQPA